MPQRKWTYIPRTEDSSYILMTRQFGKVSKTRHGYQISAKALQKVSSNAEKSKAVLIQRHRSTFNIELDGESSGRTGQNSLVSPSTRIRKMIARSILHPLIGRRSKRTLSEITMVSNITYVSLVWNSTKKSIQVLCYTKTENIFSEMG